MAGNLDEWQDRLDSKDPLFECSSDEEDEYKPSDAAMEQTTANECEANGCHVYVH